MSIELFVCILIMKLTSDAVVHVQLMPRPMLPKLTKLERNCNIDCKHMQSESNFLLAVLSFTTFISHIQHMRN